MRSAYISIGIGLDGRPRVLDDVLAQQQHQQTTLAHRLDYSRQQFSKIWIDESSSSLASKRHSSGTRLLSAQSLNSRNTAVPVQKFLRAKDESVDGREERAVPDSI